MTSIRGACAMTGIGRTKIYELIRDGKIISAVHGGKRLVSIASIEQFHDELMDDASK